MKAMNTAYELMIQNGDKIFFPAVLETVLWETERQGTAGRLSFAVLNEGGEFAIEEGNAVRFRVNGRNVFFGFVFTLMLDESGILHVTAYDQIYYLKKNKDTYVYENKTASELIRMIAHDFRLQAGDIADTGHKIASRVEDNVTLLDMIQNALWLTLEHRKKVYVLYDDFGKLTLKLLSEMKSDVLITAETAQGFSYGRSIEGEVYNKIKLTFENEQTGKRDVYIAKDSDKINRWGVLQFYGKLQQGESGNAKADALLKLYGETAKSLAVNGAAGDASVRAGSLIPVSLNLGGEKIQKLMLVSKCRHVFGESFHTMDLSLEGGGFYA